MGPSRGLVKWKFMVVRSENANPKVIKSIPIIMSGRVYKFRNKIPLKLGLKPFFTVFILSPIAFLALAFVSNIDGITNNVDIPSKKELANPNNSRPNPLNRVSIKRISRIRKV